MVKYTIHEIDQDISGDRWTHRVETNHVGPIFFDFLNNVGRMGVDTEFEYHISNGQMYVSTVYGFKFPLGVLISGEGLNSESARLQNDLSAAYKKWFDNKADDLILGDNNE